MTERRRVTCGAHGETAATFACRHLAHGVACGYHASVDDPDEPWPDAWCDLCEEAFQVQGGEWNEVSEAVAQITLMCTHCYEAARARNALPPPLTRGASAGLTDAEAEALFHHAVHTMRETQAASQRRWGWDTMASWDFDLEAGTLSFSDPARPSIVADVRLVGSYSTVSSTFQWAWETLDEGAPEGLDISRLRTFGEVRGLARLTAPNHVCDEADGWELASLAGYVLGAEALYRAPMDHLRWFMLLRVRRNEN